MARRHILFISSWYPNRNNPTHGIFNRYFAEACSRLHDISVLHVCSDENLKDDFEITERKEEGIFTVTVYYKKVTSALPFFSSFVKRKKMLRAFDLGFEKIKNEKGLPQLIQLNVVMPSGLGALRLSEKYDLPLIVNENWSGYMPEDGNYKGFFLKYFTQKIIRRAKWILPSSEILKRAMLSHNLQGKYRVIPNVVNTDFFRPFGKVDPHVTRFIHISTLDDNPKNVTGIIKAFDRVKDKNCRLQIAGYGPELEKHKSFVKEKNLQSRVEFSGLLIGEHLLREISRSHALVMFSFYETFSLVVAEAFACGKPVISSKVGIAAQIGPELGITVEPGNEEQLTQALEAFIQRKDSYEPEKIRGYAVKHFSSDVVAREFDEVYRDVLSMP